MEKVYCTKTAKQAFLYFTDMSEIDYDLFYMSCAFNYASSLELDELTLSETFWKWWQYQWEINSLTVVNQFIFNSKYETLTNKELAEIFMNTHKILGKDLRPHKSASYKIAEEIAIITKKQ